MTNNVAENPSFCPPIEKYNRETGIHRYALSDGTEITGVSANTWDEYVDLLDKVPLPTKLS